MITREERSAAAYAILRKYEKPYRLGRFTGIMRSELEPKAVLINVSETAALTWNRVSRPRGIKDFTGATRAWLLPGDSLIQRIGYTDGWEPHYNGVSWRRLSEWLAEIQRMSHSCFIWIWQEDRALAHWLDEHGYHMEALKVTSSSEYRALYRKGPGHSTPVPSVEKIALVRLNLPPLDIEPLREAILREGEELKFFAHYSSYNKRQSWSAVALRGFGGQVDDITKPAEMSKAWKAAHPERLRYECLDTTMRVRLPEVEPLLAALGGPPFQRIRLMKLSKGEGELSRHADITDKEAGTSDGKIMRLHIPIGTNPGVVFTSWDYNGFPFSRHFEVGEAFYLDTRKAHKAINGGEEDRIHLVVDAMANAERRCLISQTECL